jgi:hypothetical protein
MHGKKLKDYSYLKLSIGLAWAALRAGRMPKIRPTEIATPKAKRTE